MSHTMPGRYIVLPDQSRMLKDPVCPQELVITVSIVRWALALSVAMSISSRISYKVVDSVDKKSTFPTQTSYPSPKAKKVFGQYHNYQPAWWVSLPSQPVETARRFRSFLSMFICKDEPNTISILWYSRSGSVRKATKGWLDERVYMSFRHAGCQVYGISPNHTTCRAWESPRSKKYLDSFAMSRCPSPHGL